MKSERGAVIIEGMFSLTIFIFAMFTIYSVFHICMAQARIGSALNATAKEISQYSYIYDLTGLNQKQANLAAYGGSAQSTLSDNFAEINGLFDAFQGIAGGVSYVAASPENAESFLYYVLNQGIDQIKGLGAGEVTRLLMRKHFGADPDAFLKRLGVRGGMGGLSFYKTRLFVSGEEDTILLDVRYQVIVVKLLNIDIRFKFELCAKTRAWVGAD